VFKKWLRAIKRLDRHVLKFNFENCKMRRLMNNDLKKLLLLLILVHLKSKCSKEKSTVNRRIINSKYYGTMRTLIYIPVHENL
jgi:hypothetical protein